MHRVPASARKKSPYPSKTKNNPFHKNGQKASQSKEKDVRGINTNMSIGIGNILIPCAKCAGSATYLLSRVITPASYVGSAVLACCASQLRERQELTSDSSPADYIYEYFKDIFIISGLTLTADFFLFCLSMVFERASQSCYEYASTYQLNRCLNIMLTDFDDDVIEISKYAPPFVLKEMKKRLCDYYVSVLSNKYSKLAEELKCKSLHETKYKLLDGTDISCKAVVNDFLKNDNSISKFKELKSALIDDLLSRHSFPSEILNAFIVTVPPDIQQKYCKRAANKNLSLTDIYTHYLIILHQYLEDDDKEEEIIMALRDPVKVQLTSLAGMLSEQHRAYIIDQAQILESCSRSESSLILAPTTVSLAKTETDETDTEVDAEFAHLKAFKDAISELNEVQPRSNPSPYLKLKNTITIVLSDASLKKLALKLYGSNIVSLARQLTKGYTKFKAP